jgi:glycosyltransferase involved in cell wall biosynthesis
VHDLIPFRFPALTPWRYRNAFRLLMRRAIRVADRIIAVSESTRGDLVELLHAPPKRITVVPEAADARFHPIEDRAAFAPVRLRYALPGRFLLFVGLLEPKKNVGGLLHAVARLKRTGRWPGDLRLVVVGDRGWAVGTLPQQVRTLELEGIVRFLGHVPDADLPLLYGAAEAFVFPSLYEGFGLPVLEAMACGTPVVASTRGSLPEVAGDAAVLVDPDRPESLAEGIARVVGDPALREECRDRGLRRARAFSWRRTAEATLDVYRQAARNA